MMKTTKTGKFTSWENDTVDLFPIEIRSIDAWRNECGGWDHNNSFVICRQECKNLLLHSEISNRNLLKFLRKMDILTEESKGKVRVFESWPYIEIQLKNTFEPIIRVYFDEDNRKEFYF